MERQSRSRFHPRFEVLVSEVSAPKPGPMHAGREAKPRFAVPCDGAAALLGFQLALASARHTWPACEARRRTHRDRLPTALVVGI